MDTSSSWQHLRLLRLLPPLLLLLLLRLPGAYQLADLSGLPTWGTQARRTRRSARCVGASPRLCGGPRLGFWVPRPYRPVGGPVHGAEKQLVILRVRVGVRLRSVGGAPQGCRDGPRGGGYNAECDSVSRRVQGRQGRCVRMVAARGAGSDGGGGSSTAVRVQGRAWQRRVCAMPAGLEVRLWTTDMPRSGGGVSHVISNKQNPRG